MLRVSGLSQGKQFDVTAATSGEGDSGVPDGALLIALVEAAMARDDAALADARRAVADTLGAAAVVEAAAIIGTFNQMVRIADSTGIALDAPLEMVSQRLREEIGVGAFGSSANTPAAGTVKRTLGRVLERVTRPIQPALLRVMARRNRFDDTR
jgi:hypothetical protein